MLGNNFKSDLNVGSALKDYFSLTKKLIVIVDQGSMPPLFDNVSFFIQPTLIFDKDQHLIDNYQGF